MASQAASNAAQPRRFDGHLVIPEYGLLLDSPLNGDVDMHAFGNGDKDLKALWHSVVPETTAIKAEQCKLEPDGQDCSPGAVTIREVTIPGLGDGDEKKVSCSLFLCLSIFQFLSLTSVFQFKIAITEYFPLLSTFPKSRKGSVASLEDLQHLLLASP